MDELKPCPFCGGKPKINARQSKFIGQNGYGNKKIVWTVYIKCNKCHSRGKPIKTEPIKLYDEAHRSLGVGNFYCTEFWRGSGSGLMTATLNFEPYVQQAIEAWNRRVSDENL
jgi:hypothetical protein